MVAPPITTRRTSASAQLGSEKNDTFGRSQPTHEILGEERFARPGEYSASAVARSAPLPWPSVTVGLKEGAGAYVTIRGSNAVLSPSWTCLSSTGPGVKRRLESPSLPLKKALLRRGFRVLSLLANAVPH